MSGNRSTMIVGVVVAVLILGAVGSIAYYQFAVAPNQTSSTSTTPTVVTCGATNCAHVAITANSGACVNPASPCGFSALNITVVMGVNNTVIWNSDDTSIHTVTGSGWGSNNLNHGDTFQHTFTGAGKYQYHCAYHSGMVAMVVVKAAA